MVSFTKYGGLDPASELPNAMPNASAAHNVLLKIPRDTFTGT
jgi:hypothetical protein